MEFRHLFQIADSSVDEAGSIDIEIKLSVPGGGSLGSPASFNLFETGNGTASGLDFSGLAQNPLVITFPASSADNATQIFTVTTSQDTFIEGGETLVFELEALGPLDQVVNPSIHTLTINDDDMASLAFLDMGSNSDEGNGTHSVEVGLSVTGNGTLGIGSLERPVTVDVRDLLTGSAQVPSDYMALVPNPQSLTFDQGSGHATVRSISITIADNSDVEKYRNNSIATGKSRRTNDHWISLKPYRFLLWMTTK